eukprot:13101676-Ditylum_brightwellii.AAC.1
MANGIVNDTVKQRRLCAIDINSIGSKTDVSRGIFRSTGDLKMRMMAIAMLDITPLHITKTYTIILYIIG